MNDKKDGWLKEQLNYAKSQTEKWPEWKKEHIYNSSSASDADEPVRKSGATSTTAKMCM
jgi:hypothetical protein